MHCLGKAALLRGAEGVDSKCLSIDQEIPCGLVKGYIPGG